MSLSVTGEHLNFGGSTHGGVIFALADSAFAEAVNFGENRAVAVQVSINYLKPTGEGDVLIAEASVVSRGKTFSVCSVSVTKEDKPVAVFMGLAYRIPFEQKT